MKIRSIEPNLREDKENIKKTLKGDYMKVLVGNYLKIQITILFFRNPF